MSKSAILHIDFLVNMPFVKFGYNCTLGIFYAITDAPYVKELLL